ncbi:MAG: 2-oxo acid dehydrogenase subunit E2 [Deltaproteobacteria bacterium]|nr:2-oxo acid dehydrogenase subunit E2 [Deltaproteobacteria bacterium]
MAVPIHVPKLGMTMKEGLIVEWRAKEGDWIEKKGIVLVIETEKITYEVEAPGAGFLHILLGRGNKADVGTVIGLLAGTEEELKQVQVEQPSGAVAEAAEPPKTAAAKAPPKARAPEQKPSSPSSPAARRLAAELGVDLSLVEGTGPGGRVREGDVRKAHEEGPPAPKITALAMEMAMQEGLDIASIRGTGEGGKITRGDVERSMAAETKEEPPPPATSIPFTGMRKAIAVNMRSSLQSTAQLTTFVEVDVTEMVRFRDRVREEYKRDDSVRVSYNDIIILAVSRALKRFPIMNSTLSGDEILVHDAVNMGVAVALPVGLIVPVLRNADRKGLLEIARDARELARKAREGRLCVDEVTGGTFTVTNVSMFEVDGVTPILKPPETGILGVGRVKEKPAVYNGQITIRSMMFLSLTIDHQVVDGAPAAEFLQTVSRYLEQPYLIMS